MFSVQEGSDVVKLKGYIEPVFYSSYRSRYKECIRMLNGVEKSLEKHLSTRSMANLPESERRWTALGRLSFSFDLEAFRQAEH
ncbi:MAG: hypothetical protein JRI43_08970 [Deltaproteobacteria bacterium]|nr:hypothetical protein [Deltaproteobacteria bacterium]